MSRTERMYRRLIRLYPRHIRAHGDEMWAVIERKRIRLGPNHSLGQAWRLWLFIVLDLLRTLPATHAAAWRSRSGPQLPVGPGGTHDIDTFLETAISLLHDLRFALRGIRRRPGTAAVIVAVLAVGIGVAVSIQTANRTLVTAAVPFEDPDQLVRLVLRTDRGGEEPPRYQDLAAWQAETAHLLTLGAHRTERRFVGDDSGTSTLWTSRVTGGFFASLGVDALFGRLLGVEDERVIAESAVVISHRFWERRFGGARDVVGRTLRIDGDVHTVVGVLPMGLQYPSLADAWTILRPSESEVPPMRVEVIGRLATGVTTAQVHAVLSGTVEGQEEARGTEEAAVRLDVVPITGRPSGAAENAILSLQVAVAILLLLTIANAAGLMLTRTLRRRSEIAVRASLGASRVRVVRTVLAETCVLSATAGVLSLLVTKVMISTIRTELPATMSQAMMGWERFGLDRYGMASSLTLAVVAGAVLAAVAVAHVLRRDPTVHLRSAVTTSTVSRRGLWATRLLIAGEVALSLTILTTSGLLVRSFQGLIGSDAGFQTADILAIQWALPPHRYADDESATRAQLDVLRQVRALVGVGSADFVSNLPMSRTGWSKRYRAVGSDPTLDESTVSWRSASSGYLEALDIPLLRGRYLADADGVGADRVVVISEAMAERSWPDTDPLGEQLEVEGTSWTVVGIVGDVHNFGVQRQADHTAYAPLTQSPVKSGFLTVAFSEVPGDLADRVRGEIWRVDPDIAIGTVALLPQMHDDFYSGDRLTAGMMAVFGIVALLITAATLYTMVTSSVARRHKEIGIRIMLGARKGQILGGVLSFVLVPLGVGITVGTALSVAAAQGLARILYNVSPMDPVVLLFVPLGMGVVAMLACYVPARGAMSIDAVDAVRSE